MTTNIELLDQLKKASEGLLFTSESEAPLEPFLWEYNDTSELNSETVLQKTGHPQDTPIGVVDFDSFFTVATTEEEWHVQEERETVKKFQNLVNVLKQNLSALKVYRLGCRNIDVYVVGRTPLGDYAGLSTKVVET
jgi:uncharacterized protein YaeQ